ncbi:MAG: hypothetical protein GX568_00735 [Candidatus Gastranaerophilales bacterium]|nr:hypothetical protein [Candidatus Gastranaerophilales bacterium]
MVNYKNYFSEKLNLQDYVYDVYSNAGEDGIIKKILDTIQIKNRWCVEVGALESKFFGNTCNLILNENYSSIQIEENKDKYLALIDTYKSKPVICLNTVVDLGPNNNLDFIFNKVDIPYDFDCLCIDVDGKEYFIWKSLEQYRPKLVCIRFNPTIPNDNEFVQEENSPIKLGCNILAIMNLADKKGYKLVYTNICNAFLVDGKYSHLFNIGNF